MHVNTAEAPVYWEQIEPHPGTFDWTNVDALIEGARTHHLHLILLWFGTWKNGNDHYVPQWVKRDPQHFPRMINSAGTPLDVLLANAPTNMEADRKAFSALMHHLAEKDGSEHTILMIQVENESGGIGQLGTSPGFQPGVLRTCSTGTLRLSSGKPVPGARSFRYAVELSRPGTRHATSMQSPSRQTRIQHSVLLQRVAGLSPRRIPERHIATAGIGYPSGGPTP